MGVEGYKRGHKRNVTFAEGENANIIILLEEEHFENLNPANPKIEWDPTMNEEFYWYSPMKLEMLFSSLFHITRSS